MLVKLELLEGDAAGQVLECNLAEHEELKIGRDAAHCRFVVPAGHAAVSRQHCSLRLVLGRLRLTTNRENPVFLGGQPAWTDSLVPDGAVLRLGKAGPSLRVSFESEVGMTAEQATVLGDSAADFAEPQKALEREVQVTGAVVRRQRRLALIGGGALLAAVLGGSWIAMEARASTIALEAAVLSADERAALAALLQPSAEHPAADFAAVAARIRPSVYCVMSQHEGRWRPHGTAWVVDRDRGLLATNAHVAEDIGEASLILRGGDVQGDIAVTTAKVHPGYESFTRLSSAPELAFADGGSMPSIPACDVAVLTVAPADATRLGPSLPLAPTDAAGGLKVGATCASVGYPAEALQFNPLHPQSKTFQGHVIAISDFFLAPATTGKDALLIQIDLPVAGGASGSPLFDSEGRVAGIINAGEFSVAQMALTAEGRRIALPAGSTYAQRIDLLQEVLDDNAAAQQQRDTAWAAAFREAVGNAPRPVEEALLGQFRKWLRERGRDGESVEVLSERAIELAAGEREPLQLSAPQDGYYFVYAVAGGRQDIDLHVLSKREVIGQDTSPDWYPAVVFEAHDGQVLQIVLSNGAAVPASAMLRIAVNAR